MNVVEAAKRGWRAVGGYRVSLARRPFDGVAVLCYHGVRSDGPVPDTLVWSDLHIPESTFADHCRALVEHCTPISLAQWRAARTGGAPLPPRPVVLTFDDGYRSVWTRAVPILRRFGVPAAVFVVTRPVAERRLFWYDAVARTRGMPAALEAKALPGDAWRALVRACDAVAADGDPLAPMTLDEVAALAREPLVEIGGHSVDHPVFARMLDAEQASQIGGCLDTLAAWTGNPIKAFAYPNGRPGQDYTASTQALLAARGVTLAFTTEERFADPAGDPLQVPRFVVMDAVTGTELVHRLAYTWPRGMV